MWLLNPRGCQPAVCMLCHFVVSGALYTIFAFGYIPSTPCVPLPAGEMVNLFVLLNISLPLHWPTSRLAEFL